MRQGEEDMADSDRQPCLRGLTPEWDLKLFHQAQAIASEKTVNLTLVFFLFTLQSFFFSCFYAFHLRL